MDNAVGPQPAPPLFNTMQILLTRQAQENNN
jgi:hypothetical protein